MVQGKGYKGSEFRCRHCEARSSPRDGVRINKQWITFGATSWCFVPRNDEVES